MRIGLMSDTHDRIDAVEAAIDFFQSPACKPCLACWRFGLAVGGTEVLQTESEASLCLGKQRRRP